MRSRFWFTLRLDSSSTDTAISVLACGYDSLAFKEASHKVSYDFDGWKIPEFLHRVLISLSFLPIENPM